MSAAPSVAREYLLDAPVEAVFDAWTDADALLQWWCAGNAHATHADLDVREGGGYEIRMSPGPAGTPQIVRGLYVKVERPHRLVMTWRAEGTPHDNGDDSLLTVELFAHGGGTRLTLLHERLPAASPPSYAEGWAHVLHALSRFLGPR